MASAAAPNVKSAFKSIDTAGEGSIDRADVGRLLQLLNPGHTITQNDVLFALKEVEITDDGRVKYTEFKKWFDRLRKVLAACLRRLPRVWPLLPHHTTTSTTSDSCSASATVRSPPLLLSPPCAMCNVQGHRGSQYNKLLVKDLVGKSRTSSYDLPSKQFTFGKVIPRDVNDAKEGTPLPCPPPVCFCFAVICVRTDTHSHTRLATCSHFQLAIWQAARVRL